MWKIKNRLENGQCNEDEPGLYGEKGWRGNKWKVKDFVKVFADLCLLTRKKLYTVPFNQDF